MLTEGELLALRCVLADWRCVLLDQLAITAASTDRNVEQGFFRLLADLHTTIAAVDPELAEADGPERVP